MAATEARRDINMYKAATDLQEDTGRAGHEFFCGKETLKII